MLSAADGIRVGQAVSRAESASDGEIVTVIAAESDAYHDIALGWALLATALVLAVIAAAPGTSLLLLDTLVGRWEEWSARALLTILLVVLSASFLAFRFLFGLRALRFALVPAATKARRVRRRAILLFRVTAENRTRAKTGVLLYLSIAERRAELVADAAINGKVSAETWGHAMAALIGAVRDRRPGDGMVAAVEQIGALLAEHFPRSSDDTNELPDTPIML